MTMQIVICNCVSRNRIEIDLSLHVRMYPADTSACCISIWPFTLATLYVLSAYRTMYVYSITIYIYMYVYTIIMYCSLSYVIILFLFFFSLCVCNCFVSRILSNKFVERQLNSRKKEKKC